jgi:hypothetical protein
MFERYTRVYELAVKHFPYIQSRLDGMIAANIGMRQERGHPLTIKGLLLLKLGAPATVRRRLQRMIGMGLIHKKRADHDKRIFRFEIDAGLRLRHAKFPKLISQL